MEPFNPALEIVWILEAKCAFLGGELLVFEILYDGLFQML